MNGWVTRGTKFQQWARGYGIKNLSTAMCCTPFAVYQWLRGESIPRGDRMLVLQALARGELSQDDILEHYMRLRPTRGPLKTYADQRRL